MGAIVTFGEARMKLLRDLVEGHRMIFYGEPSPALLETMKAMGTPFTQFSLFEGLDADIEVPHELVA